MGDYIRVSTTATEDRHLDSPDPRQKAQKQKMVSPQKSRITFDTPAKSDESQVRYEEDDITATTGVTTSEFSLPVFSGSTNGNSAKSTRGGNLVLIEWMTTASSLCARRSSETGLSSKRTVLL